MIDYATLKDVNEEINDLPYTAGVDPLWEPIDADDDGGTCSNFAVAKYRRLRALKVPKELLILNCAFVEPFDLKDPITGVWRAARKDERYHAILVVLLDGKRYDMDNRKPFPTEIELTDYEWHKLWNWEWGKWEWAENADRSIG